MQSPAPNPPSRHVRHRTAPLRRWVGALWCLTDGCDTVLGEVFADATNQTYLQPVGAPPLRDIGVPCPKCGAVRKFTSGPAGQDSTVSEKPSKLVT